MISSSKQHEQEACNRLLHDQMSPMRSALLEMTDRDPIPGLQSCRTDLAVFVGHPGQRTVTIADSYCITQRKA